MTVSSFEIDAERAGQRLDNFLMKHYKGVPKARLYRAIRSGEVRVNSKRAKASTKLQAHDQVRLPPLKVQARAPLSLSQAQILEAESWVVKENDDFLVVNKPCGMAVHKGTAVAYGVIDALQLVRQTQDLYLVHRLDRHTSGCLLIAKKRSAMLELHEAWRAREVKKVYEAICLGDRQGKRRWKIDAPLLKTKSSAGPAVVVGHSGQAALSHASLITSIGPYSHLKVQIETGRMHQIRVHLAHINLPIVGDQRYGDFAINKRIYRQYGLPQMFLHASSLEFSWARQRYVVECELPQHFHDFSRFLLSDSGI